MKTDGWFKRIFAAVALGWALGLLPGCAWLMEKPDEVQKHVFYARSEQEAEHLRQSLKTRFNLEHPVLVGSGSIRDYKPPWVREAVVPIYAGKDAVVSVLGVIDSSGRVVDAVVMESSDPALNDQAIAAFKQWRFEPQRYKNRRVWALVKQPIRFEKM